MIPVDKETKTYEQSKNTYQRDMSNTHDNKPFNDVMEHLHNIEGYPTKKPAQMSRLPLPVRIVGYVLIGAMALMVLTLIVFNVVF